MTYGIPALDPTKAACLRAASTMGDDTAAQIVETPMGNEPHIQQRYENMREARRCFKAALASIGSDVALATVVDGKPKISRFSFEHDTDHAIDALMHLFQGLDGEMLVTQPLEFARAAYIEVQRHLQALIPQGADDPEQTTLDKLCHAEAKSGGDTGFADELDDDVRELHEQNVKDTKKAIAYARAVVTELDHAMKYIPGRHKIQIR
jgi:hypothetical protein